MPVSDTSPLLVLVDGSSFLYRAFFALPPLTNSRGEPTGAVYGVINMLRKLLQSYDGAHIAVVFDAPGRNFRDELFEHYKAHRPPMPDDLRSQIEPLHQAVRAMGLPMLIEPGVEADDVIGTLARQAVERGFRVVISTGDKDMAQLVCDRVTLENTMFDSRLDVKGVIAKFGVPPERIVDYLALVGDTSDNIPGVPKVGPKTAAKWLAEYGSLDALIARAGEIGGKIGENLRASLELIPLSRELATIRCDIPLPLAPESLERRPPDKAALRELYTRLEFKTLLRQLDAEADDLKAAPAVAAAPKVQTRYQAVMDSVALDRWLEKLEAAELFAFDTETSSLDYMRAEVVGLSFAVEPGEAAYVPLAHDYPGAPPQLDRATVLERLRPLLEDPGKAKLGQHLKYDANVLLNHGIMLRGIRHDTMLESYVLNSTATRHDMDSLAERYLDRKTLHYEDVAGKGAKQIPFAQVSVEDACRYAAEDADITLCLHQVLWPQLKSIPSLRAVYETIEIPLVPVLSRIERAGVLVDVYKLAEQSRELELRMAEVEAEARAVAGETFNLGSPKQIQTILYDKLGLPVIKKTPTGQPSTDESVLQDLAETFELPRLILEYRSLSKLKSTYTDKLPQQVNPVSGRVHTSYHQAVAATGRLSSSDPNLQNIPVRTEEGRRIRQAFIAPPGHKLLAADYSQIELRIMAHLSGDANLLAAFAEDADVHRATAAEVFGVPLEEVTSNQRRSAKAINFGLIYGMSAFGLAKQLGIQQKLAQGYIDLYFARYPGVRAYMDRTRESARELGYVETLFGRRLHVPDIQSRNGQRRQYAERTAINAPMQGTAADIIKRAMIAVDAWIEASRAPLRMIMQVHDELVFEVAEDFVPEATATVREHMSRAAELAVPLVVDIGTGDNWDEAH
ncbi:MULTISPECIES: DNA polymerase I [Methylococcus]|uniref:DNA polymerase I n=1 Tax=Methylococcus capsulatus TaxID=414 RepID=A0ABZ2FAJ1_METCP|nr:MULTISPECIES: DNA polymerase I [Methylococcus]MDF9391176.1 DNA polymerase I [Methylococcus capsulatus]